jgi:hypothetical protein
MLAPARSFGNYNLDSTTVRPACTRKFRHCADDVIEARCPRRLADEDVVGRQLVEPDAGGRRGEKAPNPLTAAATSSWERRCAR